MFCSHVIFIYLCCCMNVLNVLTHLPGLQYLILYLPLIHSLVRHSTKHRKCWFYGCVYGVRVQAVGACAWAHIQMHGEAKSWHWISCALSHCFHCFSESFTGSGAHQSARLAGQRAELLLSLPPQHWNYKHMAFYMVAELAVQPVHGVFHLTYYVFISKISDWASLWFPFYWIPLPYLLLICLFHLLLICLR